MVKFTIRKWRCYKIHAIRKGSSRCMALESIIRSRFKISSNGKSRCTGRIRAASHKSNSKHSKASNGLRMVNLRREKGKDESSKMPNIMVKSERSKWVNVNGRAKVDGSLKVDSLVPTCAVIRRKVDGLDESKNKSGRSKNSREWK